MNKLKILTLATMLIIPAGAVLAQATTTDQGSPTPPHTVFSPSSDTHPMVLTVGTGGKVLLRGTVDSVSASSVTVKSWGGDWTINVPASAEVLPKEATLADFKQGDFIGVQGTIETGASWTVDATLIRDWTERQAMNQEIKQNVQSVHETMKENTPRNLEGTVSGLSGESFSLTTANGTTYSVNVLSGAKIMQKNWLTVDWGKVANGDTVRVWGPVSSSTVSASIFRDLSLPK